MIPTEWKPLKLQDTNLTIIDGDRGNNYPKSDDFTDDGFCLFLSAKNITKNGFRLDEKQFISEEKDNLLRKGKLKDLDIIITTRGSVGHIAYNENIQYSNMRINSGMVILRNNDENINQKYIYKLFASSVIQRQIEKIAFGSAQPQLTVKEINNLKIPLPPLKEQEKIADILCSADDKIDAIASQIEKAEILKKGLLQKLLSEGIGHSEFKDSELGKIPESWEIDKLENLTTKIGDGLHGTPKYVEESDYYFINGNNLNGKSIEITENTKCVSEEEYTKNKKILDDTTVLLSINGTIGSLAYYSNETVMLGKSVAYMNSNNRISKQFLFYLLRSSHILDYFMLELTGTTIKNLSLKTIRNTKIPLPPLKEQKQIADILSTADEKLEVLRAKKQMYETLKKGLLQKLLSGEIRV